MNNSKAITVKLTGELARKINQRARAIDEPNNPGYIVRCLLSESLGLSKGQGKHKEVCEECSCSFTSKRKGSRFCSPKCNKKYYWKNGRQK